MNAPKTPEPAGDARVAAARHALLPQEICDLVRAQRQLLVGHLRLPAVLLDHPERKALVAACIVVEIVERPVEVFCAWPDEPGHGPLVVTTVLEQKISRGPKRIRSLHTLDSR